MGLTQSAASFVVNHGTMGSWNPDAMTVIQWVRFTSLPASPGWGDSCRMWSKGAFLSEPEFRTCSGRIDSVGNIRLERSFYNGGSYTWLDTRTNSTPIATGTDYYIAYVIDNTGTQKGRVYVGTAAALAVEQTYGTQDDPSGTRDDVSASDFYSIGGIEGVNGIDGSITMTAAFTAALTLAEIQQIQMVPWLMFGRTDKKLIALHGLNGTTNVTDYSGNAYTGTITDGALANGAPLVSPFEWAGLDAPYTVAAAVGQPTVKRWCGVPFMRQGGTTFGQGWGR